MANIKEYENPVAGFRATDTGVDAVAMAARRATQAYDQAASAVRGVAAETGKLGSETRELGSETARVGDHFATNIDQGITHAGRVASDYLTHRDISMGAVAYTKMTQTLTDAWNQMSSAPGAENDPTLAQKFRDTIMEPELQKFQEGFLTDDSQKWSLSRADALRQHMADKTTADMGNLAARAVEVHAHQTVNNLSNTAMLDPSLMNIHHLLDEAEHTVGAIVDSNPLVKGTEAAKLRMATLQQAKEAIAKAGAIGMIQKASNPEAAADLVSREFPDLINGAEVKILAANARQQIRAQHQDLQWQDHLNKTAQADQSETTTGNYAASLYSNDPQKVSAVTAKVIVNDRNLAPDAKSRLVAATNREMQPETPQTVSSQTYLSLAERVRSGEIKSIGPILDARNQAPGAPGGLTKADTINLINQVREAQTPEGTRLGTVRNEFFKRYASTVDPAMGDTHTEFGAQKMYQFQQAAQAQEADLRRRGLSPDLAYDPRSQEFMGRPEVLARFHASMVDALNFHGGK